MSHAARFVTFAALAAGLSCLATADIGPGSKAPKLDVKTWYKGIPVKDFEPGKTYVVEFWATWCGPCRDSIPHLTEMAKENTDVTFVGVSIWEDDKDGNIAKFIDEMGDKMDYNIGYSGNKEGMAVSWMEAAGQNGIPSAFIVRDGTIQWIGHPMSMEEPLKAVKAGKFDLAAFKAKFDKETDANRKLMATQKELTGIIAQFDKGERSQAKKALDKFGKAHPEMQASLTTVRFGWHAKEDPAGWKKDAEKLAAKKDDASLMQLCGFSIRQVKGTEQEVELGRFALELALKNSDEKNMTVNQYAAYFYTQTKDYKSALDAVNRVLALIPSSDLKDNEQFKASVEKQKKDLEDKLKGSGDR